MDRTYSDRTRYVLAFTALLAAGAVLIIWNVNAGSVNMTGREIFEILFLNGGEETARSIVWEIRLPRILAGIILGGALSVSGFLLQTFFANPIAGPFVLGISSGSKLVVSLAMVFFLSRGMVLSSAEMIAAAFVGAMLSMGFVLLASKKVNRMSMLVVSGTMIGYICSAITDFVVTFADAWQFFRYVMGKRAGHAGRGEHYSGGDIFDVEADQCVPARRGICQEPWREYPDLSNCTGTAFQYPVGVCHRFCRPDFVCRHCSPASGKEPAAYVKADSGNAGLFSRRRRILPVL